MVMTFGVNVGLFRAMFANDGRPCSAEDLAPLLGVERPLLGTAGIVAAADPWETLTTISARLMRHLAAMGYLDEAARCQYRLTGFSKALTIPIICDGYPCL